MLVRQRCGQSCIGDESGHFSVWGLEEVVLRHVGTLAGHGVVRLLQGEVKGVEATRATPSISEEECSFKMRPWPLLATHSSPRVCDLARNAGDDAWPSGLKVGHRVQVSLARSSRSAHRKS